MDNKLFKLLIIIIFLTTRSPLSVAQSTEELFDQCNKAQSAGKSAETESLFPKVIELEPSNAAGYFNLGNALYKHQKYEEAIAAYQKAIQIKPNFAEAYYKLGNLLQIKPKFTETYYHVGYVLDRYVLNEQSKYEGAIAAYRKAIQIKPDYAEAYYSLGDLLINQQKYEEASIAYHTAIVLNPFKDKTALYQLQIYEKIKSGGQAAVLNIQAAIAIAHNTQRQLALRAKPYPQIPDDSYFLPESTQKPLLAVLRSTAKISALTLAGFSIGSGWVVKRENNTLWIVTNRHVVIDTSSKQPSNKIEVEFYSQLPDICRPRYSAILQYVTQSDEELDLAVLKIADIKPQDIKPLLPELGRIAHDTPVTVIGHPFNINELWSLSFGKVIDYSDNDQKFAISSTTVAEGDSGGPVIDTQNQIVGMLTNVRNEGDLSPKTAITVNLRKILPATKKVGLAYRIDAIMNQLRKWKIIDSAHPAP
jgi:tetratricopeptide (TPR) repeat protein